MASGHEIVIRALGTALAGLSMAFAIYMLAYGGGKTRINGMEHLAIFAQPRGPGGAVGVPAPSPADSFARCRHGRDRFARRSAGKAAPNARPVEIVAARSRPRLAENRWRNPRRRARRQRSGPRPHRGDRRAQRRLGPARRQGRRAPRGGERRERRLALHPQEDLRVILPAPYASSHAKSRALHSDCLLAATTNDYERLRSRAVSLARIAPRANRRAAQDRLGRTHAPRFPRFAPLRNRRPLTPMKNDCSPTIGHSFMASRKRFETGFCFAASIARLDPTSAGASARRRIDRHAPLRSRGCSCIAAFSTHGSSTARVVCALPDRWLMTKT